MGLSIQPWRFWSPAINRPLFRAARRQAGLPKELVLYCARHDYGTRVLMRTGNLAAVMKTMGHRDVKTAMHYQHPERRPRRSGLQSGKRNY
jgi:integrase